MHRLGHLHRDCLQMSAATRHMIVSLVAWGLITAALAQTLPPPPPTVPGYVPPDDGPVATNSTIKATWTVTTNAAPRRTVVTVWLTDDLTGKPYAAVVHRTPRPVSFYKVEIEEEE